MVEKSSEQLTAEKKIENSLLDMAFVNFSKNGELLKTEYCVKLNPENGGATFTFYYSLDGKLVKIDY